MDLKAALNEWIAIKKNLKAVSNDLKTIKEREKQLSKIIKENMIQNAYDVVNVEGTKVHVNRKKKKTVSFSKANVTQALTTYFSGDQVKIEGALQCIQDLAQEREVTSLTLKDGGSA
jgi:DUF438 domain-containing protein